MWKYTARDPCTGWVRTIGCSIGLLRSTPATSAPSDGWSDSSSADQTGASGRHGIEVHRERDGRVVTDQNNHVGDALMPERLDGAVIQALRDQPTAGQRLRHLVDHLLPRVRERD